MNLDKRDGGSEEATPQTSPPTPEKTAKQKPVFIYILILFTVAFGLILMSFFMHQRSNEQVLGELHSNVNAIEQLQDAIDENLRLEEELARTQEQLEALETELDADMNQESAEATAMGLLYQLQQQYAGENLMACQATIAAMEQGPVKDLSSNSPAAGVVSPAERYTQIQDAVNAAVAALNQENVEN